VAADARGTTLEIPWRHEGHDHIRVMIDHELAYEARGLLVAFRTLRQASSLAEVHDQAEHIADARALQLVWGTARDDRGDGDLITIAVLSGSPPS
jgi:hypothetical protein